ncbi:hypothetical protein [Saprospira grandis]|uniref:hypothetical protein n=1 Tax=Saprospira grandis TaxID=1008 RepID=UPI0022DE6C52|nr:hypothetical protein [Saprospira grandis]WBM74391.1 hypothetical protein OP864_15505 [Saprospira grandis]
MSSNFLFLLAEKSDQRYYLAAAEDRDLRLLWIEEMRRQIDLDQPLSADTNWSYPSFSLQLAQLVEERGITADSIIYEAPLPKRFRSKLSTISIEDILASVLGQEEEDLLGYAEQVGQIFSSFLLYLEPISIWSKIISRQLAPHERIFLLLALYRWYLAEDPPILYAELFWIFPKTELFSLKRGSSHVVVNFRLGYRNIAAQNIQFYNQNLQKAIPLNFSAQKKKHGEASLSIRLPKGRHYFLVKGRNYNGKVQIYKEILIKDLPTNPVGKGGTGGGGYSTSPRLDPEAVYRILIDRPNLPLSKQELLLGKSVFFQGRLLSNSSSAATTIRQLMVDIIAPYPSSLLAKKQANKFSFTLRLSLIGANYKVRIRVWHAGGMTERIISLQEVWVEQAEPIGPLISEETKPSGTEKKPSKEKPREPKPQVPKTEAFLSPAMAILIYIVLILLLGFLDYLLKH